METNRVSHPPLTLSEQVGRLHVATPRRVRASARYDVAQTTQENRNLWAAADAFSADAANNAGVRIILRNRCRYVFANNPRAKGMIRTLAKHTVGPGGPRLQMSLGKGTIARRLNDRVESDFRSWARVVGLAKKLRILRIAKVISGEVFPKLVYNPRLPHPIKLDLQLVECDQVCNPRPDLIGKDADGVFFDDFGNRDFYRVLKVHPGDTYRFTYSPDDYNDIPAEFMLHYFDEERPSQHRGVPEIAPAAQLHEEGRRFRAAVLGASETAADFAMVVQSDASADETSAAVSPMDELELKRRMATVLPQGWKLAQTRAEQPTTTYKEFSREILSEVARCLEMPLGIASMDANDANMSSSYITNQPYTNAIEVERGDIETDVLDPMLDKWLTLAFDPMNEAALSRRSPRDFPHAWFWPLVIEHADPAKRANAQETNLRANTTTLSREYSRIGLDWETELRQRAKEKDLMKELGLDDVEAKPGAAPVKSAKREEDDEDDD